MLSKCNKMINFLDTQITQTLEAAKITLRPVKSHGLWCHILLPSILTVYNILYKVSPIYCLSACISIGLMVYSTLFLVFISLSRSVLKENVFAGSLASSLIPTLLIYCFLDYSLISSILFSLPTIWVYSLLLRYSLNFSKTFTIGEAMIVTQAIVLFSFMSVAKMTIEKIDIQNSFENVIVYTFLLSVMLMVVVLNTLTEPQRNVRNLWYIIFLGATTCLLALHCIMGVDCLLQIINYLFYNELRMKIFLYWLLLLILAIVIVTIKTGYGDKASTATRKLFHILASAVFTTGILFDLMFIKFAAGLALGLLIFVEALRKSNIEPFSSMLQSAFQVYSDEKDVGHFAMTPIYLFVGLACPLLLVPEHDGHELELLSGVLSIGIGDTAASMIGSRYGSTKWKNSERTKEGTISNILSQIAMVYLLKTLDVLHVPNVLFRTTVAAVVSGFVEAKTDQVDNLVLPLVTIMAFQLTYFL